VPARGTASYRLAYEPWQHVYNVGFRVVCEGDPKAFGTTADGGSKREISSR
jgi:hypothetical protein